MDLTKKTQLLTELTRVTTAALVIQSKIATARSLKRRKAKHRVLYASQLASLERAVVRSLAPMFKAQIKSAAKRLEKWQGTRATADTILRDIFKPADWHTELINRSLPPLARHMVMAAEVQREATKRELTKKGYGQLVEKVFCPTGPGGGIDPSCGSEGGKGGFTPKLPKLVSSKLSGKATDFGKVCHKLFGKELSIEEVSAMSGALDESSVRIRVGDGTLEIEITNKSLGIEEQSREIGKDGEETVIENSGFYIEESKKGLGTGLRSFATQVHFSAKFGLSRIETTASGMAGTDNNGYYTWPRLGYDCKISDMASDVSASVNRKYPKAEKLSDIMATKEGRDWWKAEGSGFMAEFDLSKGSQSRQVLDAYVQERFGKQQTSGKSTRNDRRRRGDFGQDLGQDWQGEKATTATEWLDGMGVELLDQEFNTPGGKVSIGVATEIPDTLAKSIQERLTETFKQPYWAKVNQTTHNDIEHYLRTGLANGQSIETMARNMAPDLLETGGYALRRAKLIARTESGNALNGARSAAIDDMIADMGLGSMVKKAWLSVLGDTTRDTHADLDGVPADANGKWLLGGVRCRWPGDVVLPVGERASCQCTLVTEFGMQDATAQQLIQDYEKREEDRRLQDEQAETTTETTPEQVVEQLVEDSEEEFDDSGPPQDLPDFMEDLELDWSGFSRASMPVGVDPMSVRASILFVPGSDWQLTSPLAELALAWEAGRKDIEVDATILDEEGLQIWRGLEDIPFGDFYVPDEVQP